MSDLRWNSRDGGTVLLLMSLNLIIMNTIADVVECISCARFTAVVNVPQVDCTLV